MSDNNLIINEIVAYIKQLTGQQLQLRPMDMNQMKNLALYVRKSFQLYQTKLLQRDIIFAVPLSKEHISPNQALKRLSAISAQVEKPVLLVLENLPAYQRSRYIEYRISFLIPGQQLFVPNLLLDLRSIPDKKEEKREYFRPSTQCILLYHLQVKNLEGKSQDSIARILPYSAMTISRSVKELRNLNILHKGKKGVRFRYDKFELWQKCMPYLNSPIRKILYNDNDNLNLFKTYLKSNIDALSYYTDIASDQKVSIAMSYDQFRNFEEHKKVEFNSNYGEIRIEIWEYDPKILSKTSYVDPLSLYLCMNNEIIDERTSIALDQLINNIS